MCRDLRKILEEIQDLGFREVSDGYSQFRALEVSDGTC